MEFAFALLPFCGGERDVPEKLHGASRLARAVELLHERFTEEIAVSELADVAELSRFQFHRAFVARCAMPPHAYQLHLRVLRAKEMLRAGRSAIEAAMKTGFADQSHFTRVFKQFTGATPGEYARGCTNVQDFM